MHNVKLREYRRRGIGMKGRTVLILVFLSFFLFSGTCEIYKKVTALNPL